MAATIDPNQQQRWPGYVKAMLLTNLVMFLMVLAIYLLQAVLPLSPDGQAAVPAWLAVNTAMSFITNTNWQNYGGENTLSYFSQMFAIIFPQFTSAATGLACGIAFIRGLGGSTNLGNFYLDMTRAITRIMLPIAFVCGVVFVGLGVPATFDGALQVNTLNGAADQSSAPTPEAAPSASSQGQQTITRGPVAALVSIKHLGTNGGGWFNANSTHPFENPGPISNILENILMALLPMGLIYTFGMMVNRRKQAATFFWVMSGFFLVFLVIAYAGEVQGNPLLASIGLDPSQGNLEGHELRFGQGLTALFVTSTTAFTTGFSEVMYMYTSMAANNGSAFAGFAGNTNWFNASGSLVLALGRYVSIILMLALAGSMAAKKEVPMTVGTMRTDGRLFGGVLAGTVLIIGALTFFPILALGPIAEHYAMWAGQTFS